MSVRACLPACVLCVASGVSGVAVDALQVQIATGYVRRETR